MRVAALLDKWGCCVTVSVVGSDDFVRAALARLFQLAVVLARFSNDSKEVDNDELCSNAWFWRVLVTTRCAVDTT